MWVNTTRCVVPVLQGLSPCGCWIITCSARQPKQFVSAVGMALLPHFPGSHLQGRPPLKAWKGICLLSRVTAKPQWEKHMRYGVFSSHFWKVKSAKFKWSLGVGQYSGYNHLKTTLLPWDFLGHRTNVNSSPKPSADLQLEISLGFSLLLWHYTNEVPRWGRLVFLLAFSIDYFFLQDVCCVLLTIFKCFERQIDVD